MLMMRNNSRHITKVILIVIFLFSLLVYRPIYAESGTSVDTPLDSNYLKSISDFIKENYNGQPTNDLLMQGAMKGMFDSLDPYTTFYTKKEADSFFQSVGGTYSGIGISMELSGEYIMVAKVFSGSPAEKAGIIQGDKIGEVDGKNIAGISLDEAASLIMGIEGSKVKLGIIRKGQNNLLTFEITRATIKINPVTYDIRNGIGCIKLDMFNSYAGSSLTEALREMDKNKITKVILDLRGNPGGEVDQAIDVARNFIPKGLITSLDYKSQAYKDRPYYSNLESPKYRLAVLVNGSSASASEIVAGAVQDTQAGTLIGTKTFGKAKVQGVIPLLSPEASAKYQQQTGSRIVNAYELEDKFGITAADDELIGYTKITLGYYYTPKNRLIDGIGITPDIVVQDTGLFSNIDLAGIQKLSKTVKPVLNSEGSDVVNAEKILAILGYDVASPDSLLDARTFTAIKKFQRDMKLSPYGVLDFTTQSVLNSKLDEILIKYDKQYAKAIEILSK